MFYQYHCTECENLKDVEHSMKENPEILCDKCNSIMKRVITGGCGVIYRGLGWVSKGTGTANKPKHTKEIGVAVPDYMDGIVDKKNVIGQKRGQISLPSKGLPI
jgi:putative FmdB family regulatory protein